MNMADTLNEISQQACNEFYSMVILPLKGMALPMLIQIQLSQCDLKFS